MRIVELHCQCSLSVRVIAFTKDQDLGNKIPFSAKCSFSHVFSFFFLKSLRLGNCGLKSPFQLQERVSVRELLHLWTRCLAAAVREPTLLFVTERGFRLHYDELFHFMKSSKKIIDKNSPRSATLQVASKLNAIKKCVIFKSFFCYFYALHS